MPIHVRHHYLLPTAEPDLDNFHAQITEALQNITVAGRQAIKGGTMGMDTLSAEPRNTNLQFLMVQSQVEGQEKYQGKYVQELLW